VGFVESFLYFHGVLTLTTPLQPSSMVVPSEQMRTMLFDVIFPKVQFNVGSLKTFFDQLSAPTLQTALNTLYDSATNFMAHGKHQEYSYQLLIVYYLNKTNKEFNRRLFEDLKTEKYVPIKASVNISLTSGKNDEVLKSPEEKNEDDVPLTSEKSDGDVSLTSGKNDGVLKSSSENKKKGRVDILIVGKKQYIILELKNRKSEKELENVKQEALAQVNSYAYSPEIDFPPNVEPQHWRVLRFAVVHDKGKFYVEQGDTDKGVTPAVKS